MQTQYETIIAVAVILLFSAFFSGMEIAYVSSNKLRAEIDRAEGGAIGRILGLFYRHPNNFISTLLVGNNIALVVYGIYMARLLEPLLPDGPLWSLLGVTLLSTLVVLFVGEFLPKTIFRLNPNAMLRAFALPALLFYIVLFPIAKFTSATSKLLLRLFGVKTPQGDGETTFTRVDLDYLIESNIGEVKDKQEIADEVKIFQNALDFKDVRVRDCTRPRTEIDAVPLSAPLEEVLSLFIESGHSKIIVYRDDIDDVIGFVHSSEMFRLKKGDAWADRILPLPIVPETMPAQKLLKTFMQQKRSVAIVVDEFGGTSGMVTMEDLVEEIFGEIEDEHDTIDYIARDLGGGEYLLSARLEIEKANELLHLQLPESDEYLTVGGLILAAYQSFPKPGETVKVPPYEFKIVKTTTTRIDLVRLRTT